MKIKGIIVDVGGVLVREVDKSARKPWQTKLHLTHRELTREVYRTGKGSLATIGKVNPEEIWLDIKKKFNLTEKEITELKEDFFAGNQLNQEFYSFIQELHNQYKTAILSNAWPGFRETYTHKYHLDKIVDQMILSDEVGMRKPNKTIFRLALQRINLKAEEVIYIDDRPDNIRTAQDLGMHVVLFVHTKMTIEKIKRLL